MVKLDNIFVLFLDQSQTTNNAAIYANNDEKKITFATFKVDFSTILVPHTHNTRTTHLKS